MFSRRRRGPAVSEELREASEGFRAALAKVEGAKATLAAAAPGGRAVGMPLAEALAGFEIGLAEAGALMDDWERESLGAEWNGCRAGLEEAARRAEEFRLQGSPAGYEELYGTLADLMEPLEVFAAAAVRFRELGL